MLPRYFPTDGCGNYIIITYFRKKINRFTKKISIWLKFFAICGMILLQINKETIPASSKQLTVNSEQVTVVEADSPLIRIVARIKNC